LQRRAVRTQTCDDAIRGRIEKQFAAIEIRQALAVAVIARTRQTQFATKVVHVCISGTRAVCVDEFQIARLSVRRVHCRQQFVLRFVISEAGESVKIGL
jgi:hypothetical protein